MWRAIRPTPQGIRGCAKPVIAECFHIVAMAIAPSETDSSLIVDSYRMLPTSIAAQGLQLSLLTKSFELNNAALELAVSNLKRQFGSVQEVV